MFNVVINISYINLEKIYPYFEVSSSQAFFCSIRKNIYSHPKWIYTILVKTTIATRKATQKTNLIKVHVDLFSLKKEEEDQTKE